MVEAGIVSQEQLVQRFGAAFEMFLYDARAEDLPKYIANLHAVEEDSFGTSGTPFEIPDFADR